MPYAYRKSAGRFGEDDGGSEMNRPQKRSSTSFLDPRKVIDMTPFELGRDENAQNDPILAQRTFNPATICNDEVSSLGNDNTTIGGDRHENPLEEVTNNSETWEQIAGLPALQPASYGEKRRSMGTPALGVQVDPGEAEPPSAAFEPSIPITRAIEPTKEVRESVTIEESPTMQPTNVLAAKKKIKHKRTKKKTVEGSVTSSDPSVSPSQRREKGTDRRRAKKKVRPSALGTSARHKEGTSDGLKSRDRSGDRSRDPRSRSPPNPDEKARRRSKSKRRASRPKTKTVNPAEIMNFLNSSKEFEAKANDSKEFSFNANGQLFEDIPVAPVDRDSSSMGNKIMSEHFRDFDGNNFEPRPFAQAYHPPSIAMTVNPELSNTSPMNSRPVTDDEDDGNKEYPNVLDIGNCNSLENAISSKPKARPVKKDRKKKGQNHILQKMFGGGTNLRGRDAR